MVTNDGDGNGNNSNNMVSVSKVSKVNKLCVAWVAATATVPPLSLLLTPGHGCGQRTGGR